MFYNSIFCMQMFLKIAICSLIYRYVLARFNEKFAEKYEREPAKIPDKWKMITVEEARDSLNEAFLSGQY